MSMSRSRSTRRRSNAIDSSHSIKADAEEDKSVEQPQVNIRTLAGTHYALTGDTVLNLSELRSGAASMLGVYVEQLKLALCSNDDSPLVYAGCEPKSRQRVDTGRGMRFITEYAFGVPGYVARWELYSGSARRVQLQAWRCIGEYQYELVKLPMNIKLL